MIWHIMIMWMCAYFKANTHAYSITSNDTDQQKSGNEKDNEDNQFKVKKSSTAYIWNDNIIVGLRLTSFVFYFMRFNYMSIVSMRTHRTYT